MKETVKGLKEEIWSMGTRITDNYENREQKKLEMEEEEEGEEQQEEMNVKKDRRWWSLYGGGGGGGGAKERMMIMKKVKNMNEKRFKWSEEEEVFNVDVFKYFHME